MANHTKSNDKQVGGEHYKTSSQVWDFVLANDLGFLEGNAIKYLTRHKKKGGIEDVKKAIHYCEKLLESLTVAAGNSTVDLELPDIEPTCLQSKCSGISAQQSSGVYTQAGQALGNLNLTKSEWEMRYKLEHQKDLQKQQWLRDNPPDDLKVTYGYN